MKISSIVKSPRAQNIAPKVKAPMRKAIAGAMMITAVLGSSAVANAKTTNNDRVINQTEVVSAEGAKALASMVVQNPTSTQMNNSIKNRLANLATTQAERVQNSEIIDETFKTYGTYIATIHFQHALNNEYYNEKLLKKADMTKYYNLFKAQSAELHTEYPEVPLAADFNTYKKVMNETSKFLYENYEPWIGNYIATIANGNDLSFDRCNKALDEVAKNNSCINIDYYNEKVDDFLFICRQSKKDVNSVKVKSDLLAYKMFLIDTMYYDSIFRKKGLYKLIHGHGLNDGYWVNDSRSDSAYQDIIDEKINPLVYIYEK